MIKELDLVVLTADLPAFGLKAGDVGTVVLIHDRGAAYEVEFVALDGGTIALETLRPDQIREPRPGEILNARATA